MGNATPFLVEAPAERTTPWRVVVDGQRSRGMSLGDAVMLWLVPKPAALLVWLLALCCSRLMLSKLGD